MKNYSIFIIWSITIECIFGFFIRNNGIKIQFYSFISKKKERDFS